MEFHIWYLKQRGWIEALGNGQLALTADGVDKLGDQDLAIREDRLLPQSSVDRTEPPDSEEDKLLPDRVLVESNGVV